LKVPKKLKLGARTVTVKVVDTIPVNDYGEAWGLLAVGDNTIYLKKQGIAQMAETLLHEMYHGMHYYLCNKPVGENTGPVIFPNEEVLTTQESHHLCIIIRDNREAIKWILQNLSK
jgi:hypothetical protein